MKMSIALIAIAIFNFVGDVSAFFMAILIVNLFLSFVYDIVDLLEQLLHEE